MKIVYSDKHAQHDPQTFFVRGVKQRSAEQPERAERLLAAAKAPAMRSWRQAHGAAPAETCTRPSTSTSSRPSRATGRSCRTPRPRSCPTSPAHYPRPTRRRWLAAPAGTSRPRLPDRAAHLGRRRCRQQIGATAADLVLAVRARPMRCRPPGHHAYADMAGGFCPEQHRHRRPAPAPKHQRVAVLDVDVHHGNGTQGIFFERDDVLTVSIHADPDSYYPLLRSRPRDRRRQGPRLQPEPAAAAGFGDARRGSRRATRR